MSSAPTIEPSLGTSVAVAFELVENRRADIPDRVVECVDDVVDAVGALSTSRMILKV